MGFCLTLQPGQLELDPQTYEVAIKQQIGVKLKGLGYSESHIKNTQVRYGPESGPRGSHDLLVNFRVLWGGREATLSKWKKKMQEVHRLLEKDQFLKFGDDDRRGISHVSSRLLEAVPSSRLSATTLAPTRGPPLSGGIVGAAIFVGTIALTLVVSACGWCCGHKRAQRQQETANILWFTPQDNRLSSKAQTVRILRGMC